MTVMRPAHPPIVEKVHFDGTSSLTVREFKLPAFSYPWHRHPEVELTWIIEGEGLRYVGDSVETFQPGDFCLIGSNLPHAWLSTSPKRGVKARSLVVQFDTDWLGDALLQLPEFTFLSRLLAKAAHGLSFAAAVGAETGRKMRAATGSTLRLTALLEILHTLDQAKARPLSLAAWSDSRAQGSDPRFSVILEYLAKHARDEVSHAELARLIGLSPSALSRLFQRVMGKTFQGYLTDLRLSLACRDLLTTDKTVSEIAYGAGFGNLSNFNRSFRLRRGITPSDFRLWTKPILHLHS